MYSQAARVIGKGSWVKKTDSMVATDLQTKMAEEIINLMGTRGFCLKSNVMYSDCAGLWASPYMFTHIISKHQSDTGVCPLRMLWGVRRVPSAWSFQDSSRKQLRETAEKQAVVWANSGVHRAQVLLFQSLQRKIWGGRRWAPIQPLV